MSWQDQIKVELIDYMGMDSCIADAARVSFDKDQKDLELLKEELFSDERCSEADKNLINYLAEHEHSSPFRHVQVKLRCTAPIWMARQLVKHQVGMSWNEVSRRYVSDTPELFQQEFRKKPDGSIKQGSAEVMEHKDVPLTIITDPSGSNISIWELMGVLENWYEDCIKAGIAPETVRGYMPLNMMTSWIWTGSLPAFFHMYRLRADGHAQKEVQLFAEKTKEVISELFPVGWKALEDHS